MKLPNAERALVDLAKIRGYLLNASHPDNGGKAQFFAGLGFSLNDPERLVDALREIARNSDVVRRAASRHGVKYVVDGSLESLRGGRPTVRTIWIVDTGEDIPRLVTAYPGGG